MIMKYINMCFEEHDLSLREKLKQNEAYVRAESDFIYRVNTLDRKAQLDIESKACFAEALAVDVAFDEGFKEGVRFILGCLGNGNIDGFKNLL